jgi:hypothetical protein
VNDRSNLGRKRSSARRLEAASRAHDLVSSSHHTKAMRFFEISAIILTLAAMASYLNYRFLRLPSTIGLFGDLNSRSLDAVLLASVIGAFVVHAFIGAQPAFLLPAIKRTKLARVFAHADCGGGSSASVTP